MKIYKLLGNGTIDLIWDLHEYLEYNKEKTSEFMKNIQRHEKTQSSKEQYIVILLEKILQEFKEPMFGYIRINIEIDAMDLDQLTISNPVKFYFWVNVGGICNILDPNSGEISPIFKDYTPYVYCPDKKVNGFKIMNDEKTMKKLILPEFDNQGDIIQKLMAA